MLMLFAVLHTSSVAVQLELSVCACIASLMWDYKMESVSRILVSKVGARVQ